METKTILLFAALVGIVAAQQKCSGNPKRYNGKLCASTTRYADYHKGACGCGPDNGDSQFGWNHDHHVTAPNQRFFDAGGAGWCGSNCGKCVRLTTTGGYIPGRGGPSPSGQSKVFMVTNLCPAVDPNMDWCAQGKTGDNNNFGYHAHFDLENGVKQVSNMGWNNPEVTYEIIDCNQGHREDYLCPDNGNYGQCFCGRNGKRSTNETADPVV